MQNLIHTKFYCINKYVRMLMLTYVGKLTLHDYYKAFDERNIFLFVFQILTRFASL